MPRSPVPTSSSTSRILRRLRIRLCWTSSPRRPPICSRPKARPASGTTLRSRSSASSEPSDGGYFIAKAAQEKLIRDSGQPFSIVHATQFFEFIGSIADTQTTGDTVTLPPVLFQPVAAADVAKAVARAAAGAPTNGIVDIAGPERGRFDEIVRRVLSSRGDPRTVVGDPAKTYFGAHVGETSLVPDPEVSPRGEMALDRWLAAAAKRTQGVNA